MPFKVHHLIFTVQQQVQYTKKQKCLEQSSWTSFGWRAGKGKTVKLFLSMPWKHTGWEQEQLHSFLMSTFKWKWVVNFVVNFKPQPFYPPGNNPLNREQGGPHTWSGQSLEIEITCPSRIWKPASRCTNCTTLASSWRAINTNT